MKKSLIRTYSELIEIPTFEERFRYLKLDGIVGENTFGYDRYLNQFLYQRRHEWKAVRNEVIIRDCGCDLGIPDREIFGPVYVHHMNPITKDDVLEDNPDIFNPEYLIAASFNTHQAIHFSNESILFTGIIERKQGDTCPWKVY